MGDKNGSVRGRKTDSAPFLSHTQQATMPQCEFYTNDFHRCTNSARGDPGPYCRVHQTKATALGERPAGCPCTRRRQGHVQWCGGEIPEGATICAYHQERIRVRDDRVEHRQNQEQRIRDALNAYLNQRPMWTWQQVTDACRMRTTVHPEAPGYLTHTQAFIVARRFFLRVAPDDTPIVEFMDVWLGNERVDWAAQAAPIAAPAQPLGQMGRLAADTQNVHREVVAKQTNSNVALLLAEEPLAGMDTLSTLTTWWTVVTPRPPFESYWRVMEDVRHWYNKRTCKGTNDYLYQKVLDGLLAKVLGATESSTQEDELFTELARRIWEECEEAVGMCCEGHISRLANVLVGFDEAFKPPVSAGEILQTKMAAIAELKVSHKHKLQRAVELMDELKIPVADRAPWLEALEE